MNTPTKVLFILDLDLPGEGLQRGREELSQGQREGERDKTEFSGLHLHRHRGGSGGSPPLLSVASRTMKAFLNPLPVCEPPTSASRPTTARFCRARRSPPEALWSERRRDERKDATFTPTWKQRKAHVSTA